MYERNRLARVLASGLPALVLAAASQAHATAEPTAEALAKLSIEELANVPVTSVSKRAEPLSTAPASAYVITGDAVHRAGARSIAEALRLAPNLEVSRIDALDYSITARGFGGFESAEKLLVVIDGRSVYTPLFSGVDWDQQHVMLEDLDRIEVISGPGGTLWGANAVDGVVNVVTKPAFETLGPIASGSLGTLDRDLAGRLGLAVGPEAAVRVYGTAFRRGPMQRASGDSVHDQWNSVQGGFRFDWAHERQTATLQGDAHSGDLNSSLGLPGFVRGQDVLGRWSLDQAHGAIQVQGYYDHFSREARLIHDELTTWDLEAQQTVGLGDRHQIVWGAGLRLLSDDFRTLSEPQLLSPPHRRTSIANGFVQDEIALTPALALTLGAKLEHNSYTGTALMPNARLGWRLSGRQFLWAAVSRAVRDPSRIERDFQIPGLVVPGRMGAEDLIAFEAGYKGRLTDRADVSVTGYVHRYTDLRSNELSPGGTLPIFVGNGVEGYTYGLEAWGDVDVTSRWRLSLGASVLGRRFENADGHVDLANLKSAGADPGYWLKARSSWQIARNLDLDLDLRVNGRVPQAPSGDLVSVPAYAELDGRLAWRLSDQLEVALVGENLIHDRHLESVETRRTYIPRSVSIALQWRR